MSGMFYRCFELTNVDLSNFNTTNVINMEYMFSSCKNLVTIFNVNGNVSNYSNMFYMAAINPDAKITVNYTAQTSSLVDQMIATKSTDSNVVKGVQID